VGQFYIVDDIEVNDYTKELGDLVQDILDNGEDPSIVAQVNNIIDRMYEEHEN